MRILITDRRSLLGRRLVAALGHVHEVVTLDTAVEARDRDGAVAATAGCTAVVHLPLASGATTPTDLLDIATRSTYNLLTGGFAGRFVLVSALHPFERYPRAWRVNEYWMPRPTTAAADLAPYLAELTAREVARVRPVHVVVLRLGDIVDGAAIDAHQLHVEDAIHAVERALAFEPDADHAPTAWSVFHIPAAGRARFPLGLAGQPPFAYTPRHAVTTESAPAPSADLLPRPLQGRSTPGGTVRRVVVYGAGGPLAAATTELLHHDHVLRLTDAHPLAEIVARGEPQSPGAPLPRLLDRPHELAVVDVTDYQQVLAAARGMDAILNCTVVRPHPVDAFRVNMLGAYHVMRASVELGIRRVVHTGPFQAGLEHPAGYGADWDLVDEVPARPGDQIYLLTKLLGQEICRIFAEEHALEVPALLFCSFVAPEQTDPGPMGTFPFSVSWQDAAVAMRQALHAPAFPAPFEIFHILTDLPHGKYRNAKAKQLLGWQPRDRLDQGWQRTAD